MSETTVYLANGEKFGVAESYGIVRQRIERATDTPGGLVTVIRANGAGMAISPDAISFVQRQPLDDSEEEGK